MRRRDTYWSLFHTPEKRQINDLRTDHVEAIFEALPVNDHKDWAIWREGFRTWKPFADFPQLLLSLRNLSPSPSENPAPPKQQAPETRVRKINDPIETIALEIADETDMGERDRRYPKKWDLAICVPGQPVIHAKTLDVSLHGMQLTEPVTASLPRYFTVEINGAGRTFSVVCSAVRAFDMQPTSRLKIEVNDQMPAYTAAVLSE